MTGFGTCNYVMQIKCCCGVNNTCTNVSSRVTEMGSHVVMRKHSKLCQLIAAL